MQSRPAAKSFSQADHGSARNSKLCNELIWRAAYYRSAYTTAEQARALASHKLEIPLLAIAGQNGIGRHRRTLVEAFAQKLHGDIVLDGAGHFVPEERPHEALAAIAQYPTCFEKFSRWDEPVCHAGLTSQFTAFMSSFRDDGAYGGKQWAQATEDVGCTPVRDFGRLDSAGNRQAQCIDKDVALAPLHEFVSIEATNAAFCRFHRLPVHDNHRGTRRPAGFSARLFIDGSLQAGPHTGVLPEPEIVIHGAPEGKIPAAEDATGSRCAADRKSR